MNLYSVVDITNEVNTMTRNYTRKSDTGPVQSEAMLNAVKCVVELRQSIRKVAKRKGISKSTLQRYVTKYGAKKECSMVPNYLHSKVFSAEQEVSLADYLKTASQLFHGLTPVYRRGNLPLRWQHVTLTRCHQI